MKHPCFEHFHKSDEDLKMIGVSPIDSLFGRIKIDNKGTEEESTLASVATRPQTVKPLCISVIPGSVMLTRTVLEDL